MKSQNILRMLTATLILVLITFGQDSFAQKIVVKKTKGKSAIIESSVPLEEGQVYDLQTEVVAQDVDYKATGLLSRQNSLSFGGSFLYLKNDDYYRNNLNLQLRYGWNFSSLEFGAVGDFSTDDFGAGATNIFSAGGYFDYNMISNRDPKSIIYGPFSLVTFGSTQYPSSKGGGSSTTIDLNAGAFLTWFMLKTTTALRAEAFADYQQVSTTIKQSNVLGFGSRALLLFYY